MILENGKQYEGDILVGADGIWSKVIVYLMVVYFLNYVIKLLYSMLGSFQCFKVLDGWLYRKSI